MIPEEWRDHTINAFSLPAPNGKSDVSFAVSRDTETRSPDVNDYADRQLVEAAKKLARYHFISRYPTQVGGYPAMEVNYTWVPPSRIDLYQRQAFVHYGSSFLVFTLSARVGDFERHLDVWAQVMSNVRLRG